MKRIVLLPLSFALVGFLFGSLASAESLESDLQSLLKQFVNAWDKSDSNAIAALFENNSDLVIPSGLLVEGRGDIEKFYASTFDHGYRGSRVSASLKRTRRIRSDMVIVDGEWTIEGALVDGRAEAPEVGIFSLVARHRGGKWVICSLREQDRAHSLTRFSDGRPLDGPAPSTSDADPATTVPSDAPDRRAIKELDRKDIAAVEENDLESLIALWTEESVLLLPGSAPVVGRPAIREVLLQQQQHAAQSQRLGYDEAQNRPNDTAQPRDHRKSRNGTSRVTNSTIGPRVGIVKLGYGKNSG